MKILKTYQKTYTRLNTDWANSITSIEILQKKNNTKAGLKLYGGLSINLQVNHPKILV